MSLRVTPKNCHCSSRDEGQRFGVEVPQGPGLADYITGRCEETGLQRNFELTTTNGQQMKSDRNGSAFKTTAAATQKFRRPITVPPYSLQTRRRYAADHVTSTKTTTTLSLCSLR